MMHLKRYIALCLALLVALPVQAIAAVSADASGRADGLYLGADLSFTNEMGDCGAVYRRNGKPVDPFVLLKASGGNLVRVRLWNHATWTKYSDLADVEKTIRRARAAGLKVLLDFHYSDDWADGEKQIPPAAWANLDTEQQVKALHDFTYATLRTLDKVGLMPDMVQVGNEINFALLGGTKGQMIDWKRNASLINAGVRAVREAGTLSSIKPKVMLHIAQPENVQPWFDAATLAGVMDYDIIGISYYRKWSSETLAQLGATIARVKARYHTDVMLVETAYPFTFQGNDDSPNVLGDPSVLNVGYPATETGQRDYMIAVTEEVARNGGIGVVYWAPDWVSTKCRTRWGVGSNWENAAWFSLHRHEALPVFDFLRRDYSELARAGS